MIERVKLFNQLLTGHMYNGILMAIIAIAV